ncbi:MAG: hypothetical protein LBC73_02745 [Oscillospiraceae bacterium]|jgi:hypothetical protein|nr:hypothetical protein [Oscillospiraceae bacterium]
MQIFSKLKESLGRKKTKEELDAHYDSIELEKGDFPAMVIAALITFVPVVIIAMIVIYGLIWIILIR